MARRLLVLALAACGGGGPGAGAGVDAAPAAAATLALGSGAFDYQPLVEGGPIVLNHGPQGGYHFYLTLRATGVDPGLATESPRPCSDAGVFQNPCIDFDVIDDDTGRTLDDFVPLHLPLTESQPGSYDLLPPRLVVLSISSFDELVGHHVRVRATIDDAGGRHHVEEALTLVCVAAQPSSSRGARQILGSH